MLAIFAILVLPFNILMAQPSTFSERFELIGAIVSQNPDRRPNVAIVRDRKTNRSLVLREGEPVAQNSRVRVKKIDNKSLWLSNGEKTVRLTKQGFSSSRPETRDDLTSWQQFARGIHMQDHH